MLLLNNDSWEDIIRFIMSITQKKKYGKYGVIGGNRIPQKQQRQ